MILYWSYRERKLGGTLIIESKIIYLFDNMEKIAKGVLTSKDHLKLIKSNVPYLKIDGPNHYYG